MRFNQQANDSDDYYEQAEAIAKSINDDFALSFVYHHRGYQLINKPNPDYENGRRLSDEAAKIAAKLGLTDIHFWSLLNRGSCEHELSQFEQALATHHEAFDLARGQNNHYWMAGVQRSIGEDYDRMGNHDLAQQAFDESLSLWRHVKAKTQIADLTDYLSERDYTIRSE